MAAPEGYNALGKIGISYKGEYSSTGSYTRLDAVYHNGSSYLALKDAPSGAPNNDGTNWMYLAKGFAVDVSESQITFEQASERENIASGESIKTVFGKIKKWFADMTTAAFAQIITSNTDLMALTKSGYLADALAVKNQFDAVNSKLINIAGQPISLGFFRFDTPASIQFNTSDYRFICIRVLLSCAAYNYHTIPVVAFVNAAFEISLYENEINNYAALLSITISGTNAVLSMVSGAVHGWSGGNSTLEIIGIA